MDQAQIKAALAELENLSKFARDSEIPIRTLQRVEAGERRANSTTLRVIEAALKKLKPAKKQPVPPV
jgi:predicted transcriptional regulator